LQEEKDGQGQKFSQGGFLVPLLWGELEPLGLQGLELVIHPDVDSYQKGFCVKIVEGVLPVGVHSTSLFSHPEDPDQVANEGISYPHQKLYFGEALKLEKGG
jgi:hypothetical protein